MASERPTGQAGAQSGLSSAQRHAEAQAWLRRANRPVTPEAVEELAPWMGVYEPGSGYERAARELVACGQVPIRGKVGSLAKKRSRIRAERQARRRAAIGFAVVDLDQAQRQRLLDLIAGHRAEHGTGPGWAVVREHMGWSKGQVEATLMQLRSQGVVSFTDEPGSLDVTTPGQELPA